MWRCGPKFGSSTAAARRSPSVSSTCPTTNGSGATTWSRSPSAPSAWAVSSTTPAPADTSRYSLLFVLFYDETKPNSDDRWHLERRSWRTRALRCWAASSAARRATRTPTSPHPSRWRSTHCPAPKPTTSTPTSTSSYVLHFIGRFRFCSFSFWTEFNQLCGLGSRIGRWMTKISHSFAGFRGDNDAERVWTPWSDATPRCAAPATASRRRRRCATWCCTTASRSAASRRRTTPAPIRATSPAGTVFFVAFWVLSVDFVGSSSRFSRFYIASCIECYVGIFLGF